MALDQAFDADTLLDLRKAVLAVAAAAGMPNDRATEVMLAVHELAANTVRHGGGTGRVRMHAAAGELHCQVSDAGPGSAGPGSAGPGSADGYPRSGGTVTTWPVQPGHGLWLVQNVADRVSVAASPRGSEVTVVFALAGLRDSADGH
ncbi:MAG TPA: ATP-binding protein [Streptosporangiaceae bacterium]|nr:ATP-binding protein [Streptosporangiaceae bacterium]